MALIIKVKSVHCNSDCTLVKDPTVKLVDMPIALQQSIGFLLGRAAASAREDFRARLVAQGVNAKHYTVLSYVDAHGPQSQSAIGTGLALDRTTMVQLIDELEQLGVVERGHNAANRRAYLVQVTPAGRTLVKRLARAAAASDAAIQAGLSAEEVVVLRDLLTRLVANQPTAS